VLAVMTTPPPEVLPLSSSMIAACPMPLLPVVNVTPMEFPASPSGKPSISP